MSERSAYSLPDGSSPPICGLDGTAVTASLERQVAVAGVADDDQDARHERHKHVNE